jgi:hypothetical protein
MGDPMGNPQIPPGIIKIMQNGALVLEKKRSGFYFQQDDSLSNVPRQPNHTACKSFLERWL